MKKRLKIKLNKERTDVQMKPKTNIPDDGIDRSIYEEPYVIKDGCLCEEVMTKNGTAYVKLADYVPVLRSEITYDDGDIQKSSFSYQQNTPPVSCCRRCLCLRRKCRI